MDFEQNCVGSTKLSSVLESGELGRREAIDGEGSAATFLLWAGNNSGMEELIGMD